MVRKPQEQIVESVVIANGNGETEKRALLNAPAEMDGKGRLFSLLTLAPGHSIGQHVHTGETETFYVTKGSGIYNDNGTEVPFTAGDVLFVADGDSHSVKNTGTEPLEMVALILYT